MAATLIPNQTVSLIENDETLNQRNKRLFWHNTDFCQLTKTSETSQFQIRLTPLSGDNLIGNGKFLTNLNTWSQDEVGTWVWDSGTATSIPIASHQPNFLCNLFQPVSLQANKTYRLTLDVRLHGIGVISLFYFPNSGTCIGGISNPSAGTSPTQLVDQTSTLVTYWRITTGGSQNFYFSAVHQNILQEVKIDNIELVEMSEPVVTLEDCDGNYLQDINTLTRFEDVITYSHKWNDDRAECQRICIFGSEDFGEDYIGSGLCVVDHRHRPIFDSSGECIKYFG